MLRIDAEDHGFTRLKLQPDLLPPIRTATELTNPRSSGHWIQEHNRFSRHRQRGPASDRLLAPMRNKIVMTTGKPAPRETQAGVVNHRFARHVTLGQGGFEVADR